MADKKLNSVSSVTDAVYVYAETSNGEIVKISKADLASVVAESIGVVGVKKGLLRGFMTASIEGGQAVSINASNAACLVGFSPYYGSFISMFGYRSNSLSTIMSPSLSNLISITKDDNVYAVKINNIHTSPVSITYTYIDYNDSIA